MRNDWTCGHFGDYVTMLSGGTPSKAKSSYWNGDIPWVSCKDMKTERLFDTKDHLSQEGVENGTRMVKTGTVLIVVRGMILAKAFPVAIAKKPLAFNQDLKALKCAPGLDDQFLFYWLKSKTYDILGIADEAAHGTKRIQTDRLQNLEISIPPQNTQRAIVAVLSSYDDLIENNTRRIKILEDIAQMLYREWFVNFRFPGHENMQMVESEWGPIPTGWHHRTVAELLESSLGGDWGSDSANEADDTPVYVIRGTDFDDLTQGAEPRSPKRFISSSSAAKRLLRSGDIQVENSVNAKSRCTGKPHLIDSHTLQRFAGNCIAASFCKVFRPLNESIAPLLYLHIEHLHRDGRMVFYQNVAANGIGNFQSSRFIASERLALPECANEINALSSSLQRVLEMRALLGRRIGLLRTTRDFLLPKLITGEIPVEVAAELAE